MTTEAPRRRMGTVVDMVRSLGIVLAVIAVVALINLRPEDDGGPRVIEYGTELAAARAAAPYDVLAPADLDGYLATSVRYSATDAGTVWHLGFVTPQDEYVGLDQTDGTGAEFVGELTEDATAVTCPDGVLEIGGRSWQRLDGGGDGPDEVVRGLRSEDADVTTLVSGTAEWDELEEFAAALSATGG